MTEAEHKSLSVATSPQQFSGSKLTSRFRDCTFLRFLATLISAHQPCGVVRCAALLGLPGRYLCRKLGRHVVIVRSHAMVPIHLPGAMTSRAVQPRASPS